MYPYYYAKQYHCKVGDKSLVFTYGDSKIVILSCKKDVSPKLFVTFVVYTNKSVYACVLYQHINKYIYIYIYTHTYQYKYICITITSLLIAYIAAFVLQLVCTS
jgi:hypothetical protein